MYFTLTAQLDLNQPHFKCSAATRGQWYTGDRAGLEFLTSEGAPRALELTLTKEGHLASLFYPHLCYSALGWRQERDREIIFKVFLEAVEQRLLTS